MFFSGASTQQAGWTVFTQTTGAIFYVSQSTGNDANNGTSTATPVKTLAHGLSLLTSGHSDWLLLKCGDTWTDENLPVSQSGLSSSQPLVIGSYTTTTPATVDPFDCAARPLIQTVGNTSTTGACIFAHTGTQMSFVAIVGLECYSYKRDPGNGSFTAGLTDSSGLEVLSAPSWLLIEDCKFSFYLVLTIQGPETLPSDPNHIGTVIFNRNIVYDNYPTDSQHSQGMYVEYVKSLSVIESVFDHNGWNATTGTSPTGFNHDLYVGNDIVADGSPVTTINGSVFSNASSNGIQGPRPGGTVLNNLIVKNPIAAFTATSPSHLDHNVVLNGNDNSLASGAAAQGLVMQGSSGGSANPSTMNGNIVAHTSAPSSVAPIGYQLDGNTSGSTATGNIVCDWNATNIFLDQGTGNNTTSPANTIQAANCNGIGPDPANSTIEAYDTSLGGPGTLADFLSKARGNRKHSWNTAYTAGAANNFIRQKLGMAAYPFLLKRDLNPANDNTPMWLNEVA